MKKTNKKHLLVDEGILHAVGHDIKQPLGLIRAYSYYIKKTVEHSQPQLRPYTDKIDTQVDVLTNMLQNMLESIKFQNNQIVFTYHQLSISELLEQVILELSSHYSKTKIVSDFGAKNDNIKADKLYLSLAFKNIIENALQFSKEDSSIQIKTKNEGNTIAVEIINSGSVIPKSDIPNLATQFYKGKNAKDSLVKGLGLGLFVAKEIVNLQGGTISFSSTSSSTVVVVTLPLLSY